MSTTASNKNNNKSSNKTKVEENSEAMEAIHSQPKPVGGQKKIVAKTIGEASLISGSLLTPSSFPAVPMNTPMDGQAGNSLFNSVLSQRIQEMKAVDEAENNYSSNSPSQNDNNNNNSDKDDDVDQDDDGLSLDD